VKLKIGSAQRPTIPHDKRVENGTAAKFYKTKRPGLRRLVRMGRARHHIGNFRRTGAGKKEPKTRRLKQGRGKRKRNEKKKSLKKPL